MGWGREGLEGIYRSRPVEPRGGKAELTGREAIGAPLLRCDYASGFDRRQRGGAIGSGAVLEEDLADSDSHYS